MRCIEPGSTPPARGVGATLRAGRRRCPTAAAAALAFALLAAACEPSHGRPHFGQAPGEPAPAAPEPADFEVPPPPFTEGAFPCSDCHDPEIEVNTTRRPMRAAHQEIVLRHDEANRWCLDCHSAEDRDRLHLASGERIDFSESYRLCGQCHGDKYRDWRAGVHGRRTGNWDGEKRYLLCVNCHNAHSPRFAPIQPEPPPVRPEEIKR
jgi:hypothetical protein